MAGFGEGLGQFIGAALADESIGDGINRVNSTADGFNTQTQPYNTFGQSFLDDTAAGIKGVSDVAGTVKGYDEFMAGWENSPAVKYQLQQADARRDSSASARSQLLSGANLRAASEIDSGIIAQGANTAYNEYLMGNNQQFGQLETALGNMFQAIGVGQTATGQQAGVASSSMAANTQLAALQAKNDNAKGSGLGSMFGGLGSLAAMF